MFREKAIQNTETKIRIAHCDKEYTHNRIVIPLAKQKGLRSLHLFLPPEE